jgi:uncharacterized protein YdaU (DUF1376 family)
MSIIHIAFYPSDWLAGTRGLTDSETGVYITLISRMYEMAAPIEREDNRLARLCGCKTKVAFVKALNHLISEGKIIETDEGLFNDRVGKEIKITTEKSVKARAAAESRWNRKNNNNNGSLDARAPSEHMPQRCQSESESYKEPNGSFGAKSLFDPEPPPKTLKRAVSIPDDWVPSNRNIQDAIDRKFSTEEIDHEAHQFRDHHLAKGTRFRNWDAGWRSWLGNARKFSRDRNLAGKAGGQGGGSGRSIASIVARRHVEDQI